MHYSIMTTVMTLRCLGCALCMPFISPFRSPFRPYNRAYAYRGLTAFAPLSMAVSERVPPDCPVEPGKQLCPIADHRG
ncbi:MAG: hypothetical protein KZQ60_02685 [Candidatus Thiodiazotropha sp. (ex Lucinoma aequizonata)]|nr:hypothetical protein [Candidatus Thiodiazotropha sp. (ex Lucinoma aequizonata)]